jgi:conjugative relaxase-like TrwC/TraI family protein
MLSISKLRVGQEAYQLSGVAQSLDDYYTGAGEAAGRWVGTGAARLGLDGDVEPDDLRAVLAGIRPGTGGLDPNGEQIRPHPRRVPGFDLTFKAPKSVSVLYAVSDDPRVQGAIIEAGEAAVRASLGWMEREAVRVRRGSGDRRWLADLATRDPDAAAAAAMRVLPGEGVVAAVFRHRTSRAGDPLLHWHTLVANLTEGPDQRWSALLTPDLHRGVRAAGEVFQAVLRDELSASLGVEWRSGRHVPEIAGVPEGLCEAFSKRSREVEAWLEATGTPDDAAGRQAAVLATRRNKPEVEDQRFDAVWKAEALDLGWGADAAERLIESLTPGRGLDEQRWALTAVDTDEDGRPYRYERVVHPEEWIAEVLRHDLTATSSTFTMPQLVQAVAARLTDGASMDLIERTVARVLASPQTMPVAGLQRRWTTTELLAVEERFISTLETAADLTGEVAGLRDEALTEAGEVPLADGRAAVALVDEVLASRPTIGEDQAEAVRALVDGGDRVSVLVGPAGTGKTFALDALREALQQSGMRVIGAAPSARAALELDAGAGIESVTLHRLLGRWARGEDAPTHHTVLVVDEAGMASIRDLEAVVSRVAAAGGRVVLSGDHHQLPEVGPGGGFAAAVDRSGTVAELSVNRRQQESWEQDALLQIRHGDVAHAVDAYRRHDRLRVVDDPAAAIDEAVALWRDAVRDGRHPVLLAGTTSTVDALNRAVRASLIEDGALTDEVVGKWSGREFAVGDRVVLRANSYREIALDGTDIAVLNGQAATVIAGDTAGLTIALDGHAQPVRLEASYLDAGGIDHGYALTTHRAQGGTWDLAIAVGSDGLYREAAYVQLSRGRHTNRLVLARHEVDAFDAELVRHDHGLPLPGEVADDPYEDLIEQLRRSGAKSLALTEDPDAVFVHRLAATMSFPEIEERATHARQVEAHVREIVGADPDLAIEAVVRAHHTATHLAVGMQVKAYDRLNIGTAVAVNDHDGTATVRFLSATGRSAIRDLPWDQLAIVTPRSPAERDLTHEAAGSLDEVTAPHLSVIASTERLLEPSGQALGDAERWERAAADYVQAAADSIAADPPGWLTDLLGIRPEWPAAAQVWDDAVRRVARTTLNGDDAGAADGLSSASRWLEGRSDPSVAELICRSPVAIETRRQELGSLLASAPPDRRGLVDRLRKERADSGLDAEALVAAADMQGDRPTWITVNWPHVVEARELDRAADQFSESRI